MEIPSWSFDAVGQSLTHSQILSMDIVQLPTCTYLTSNRKVCIEQDDAIQLPIRTYHKACIHLPIDITQDDTLHYHFVEMIKTFVDIKMLHFMIDLYT